jgi:hypothetical protein
MRDEELAALERYYIELIISKLMNGTVVEPSTPTLGFLLHDVARLLRRRFEQNARGCGLTRSQWQVLACLANNEGINQSGLADVLEIEPITLGHIVDKLQTLRLVERHPDPSDRRVWLPSPDARRPSNASAAAQARRGHPQRSARRSSGSRHRMLVEDTTGPERKPDGRVRFAGCRTKESEPWLI